LILLYSRINKKCFSLVFVFAACNYTDKDSDNPGMQPPAPSGKEYRCYSDGLDQTLVLSPDNTFSLTVSEEYAYNQYQYLITGSYKAESGIIN